MTILSTIHQQEIEQIPGLYIAVQENKLLDDVTEQMSDAVHAAAMFLSTEGLPIQPHERNGALAALGELFLSHMHAAMESEVSELPDV